VQGIKLVRAARLLGKYLRQSLAGDGKRRLKVLIAGDLAADVTVEPTQPGP